MCTTSFHFGCLLMLMWLMIYPIWKGFAHRAIDVKKLASSGSGYLKVAAFDLILTKPHGNWYEREDSYDHLLLLRQTEETKRP